MNQLFHMANFLYWTDKEWALFGDPFFSTWTDNWQVMSFSWGPHFLYLDWQGMSSSLRKFPLPELTRNGFFLRANLLYLAWQVMISSFGKIFHTFVDKEWAIFKAIFSSRIDTEWAFPLGKFSLPGLTRNKLFWGTIFTTGIDKEWAFP